MSKDIGIRAPRTDFSMDTRKECELCGVMSVTTGTYLVIREGKKIRFDMCDTCEGGTHEAT